MAKPQRYLISDPTGEAANFMDLASRLAETGRGFYQRGWALGTSGNFSTVLRQNPLQLAITSSGVDKSILNHEHILQVDAHGNVLHGRGRPSAETHLHLTLVRLREARAVLHTHSIWGTVLSDRFAFDGGVKIEGYETLPGQVAPHAGCNEVSPEYFRTMRIPILRGLTMPLADGLRLEAFLSASLRGTEDAVEGPKAFAEKRKPNFQAR